MGKLQWKKIAAVTVCAMLAATTVPVRASEATQEQTQFVQNEPDVVSKSQKNAAAFMTEESQTKNGSEKEDEAQAEQGDAREENEAQAEQSDVKEENKTKDEAQAEQRDAKEENEAQTDQSDVREENKTKDEAQTEQGDVGEENEIQAEQSDVEESKEKAKESEKEEQQVDTIQSVAGQENATLNGVVQLTSDAITYNSIYTQSKQIPCEELGGIYFLNNRSLTFYNIATGEATLVQTFLTSGTTLQDTYVNEETNKLYILEQQLRETNSYITVYNLKTQTIEKTIPFAHDSDVIGADNSGRIYVAGVTDSTKDATSTESGTSTSTSTSNTTSTSSTADTKTTTYTIYLLSAAGEQLSEATTPNEIYHFCGFDSTNGNFYVESYVNWIYWGYDHSMSAVKAGNVAGNTLTFYSDTSLCYACQKYFYERQEQVTLLGNQYLCVDSTFNNNLQIWDSNNYKPDNPADTTIFSVSRSMDNFSRIAAVGVRAIYKQSNDTIIAYKDDATIAQFRAATGEEIATVTTAHPVFSLLSYGDGVMAIEREVNDDNETVFYLEYFPWKAVTSIQITGESSSIKVGQAKALHVTTDGTIDEALTWSSSNCKVATVSEDGNVFGWKAGTAAITVTTKGGISATYTITVTENASLQGTSGVWKTSGGTKTENVSKNNYTVYGSTVKSYVVQNEDGTLTRVEYDSDNKNIVVETYKIGSEKATSKKTIAMEFSLFGGMYCGKAYNYIVYGQKNDNESDDAEVLRIVKYTKNWEKITEASIKGANTYIPFDAGSLRMTQVGETLYVYTCHEMYASSDGYHHQANMTFVINESDLSVAQSYYSTMNISYGYVSHSFNQFIQSDGANVYRVDHGDAYPRGISITKCGVDKEITDVDYTIPISLSNTGATGANATGASIGGFELSTHNCLIVGNSVDYTKTGVSVSGKRNIFVSVTSKQLEENAVLWLTSYDDSSDVTVRTPQLVKLGEEQFLILWEEYNSKTGETTTKSQTIDENGNKTSDVITHEARLSDCQPILCKDGLVRWYTTNNDSPVFYALNPYKLTSISISHSISTPHTHTWSGNKITKATTTKNGKIVKKCTGCGETKLVETIAYPKTVTLSKASYTYNRKVREPSVTVTDANGTTIDASNYKVTYSAGRCDAGTYNVTVAFRGKKYSGSVTKTFTIKKTSQKISVSDVTKTIGDSAFSSGAVLTQGDGALSYKTSDKAVATVDKNGKITLKGVGQATITVVAATTKNYKKKTVTFLLTVKKPTKVTLSSVTNKASKKMLVKWKKNKKADAYEIQYGTSKSFKNAKTIVIASNKTESKTIGSLTKKKTYYVRVRCYKKVGSKKYHSSWSSVKKVTITK